MSDRPRYVLTFEALDADTPATVRVRWLLEHALRSLKLRCVEAVELKTDEVSEERNEDDGDPKC